MNNNELITAFHNLFYKKRIFKRGKWQGIEIWKSPLDLWLYQEIIFDKRPEIIIETGSYRGASAHFFATMLQVSGQKGKVFSIDVQAREFPSLPNLEFIKGNSIDVKIVERMQQEIQNKETMVVLDSDHRREHVLNELRCYAPLVTRGQYLIVEDTNLNGHPVLSKGFNGKNPGPMEAVEEFLADHPSFTIDKSMHKFLITMHPNGFLLKN